MLPTLNYNEWHSDHVKEDDTTTIWYQFVLKSLDFETDINEKDILEIGCGRGGFASYLAGKSSAETKITASDFSDFAIDQARQRFSDVKIEWRKEDIQKLSFKNNLFDTIISCETIEHVPEPQQAILELYRVLKPGGRLFLTCPNYFNLFGIWCLYRWIIGKPYTEGGQPYVNYILMPFIYRGLRKAGFRVHQYYSADIVLPLSRPKHFFFDKTPKWLTFFGFRSFYVLKK